MALRALGLHFYARWMRPVVAVGILLYPSDALGLNAACLLNNPFPWLTGPGETDDTRIVAKSSLSMVLCVIYISPAVLSKTFYIVMIFLGTILSMSFIWELTDFVNLFLAIPNLYALFLLRRDITCK